MVAEGIDELGDDRAVVGGEQDQGEGRAEGEHRVPHAVGEREVVPRRLARAGQRTGVGPDVGLAREVVGGVAGLDDKLAAVIAAARKGT